MKTIKEINEKIKTGRAVVFTAEEIPELVREKGVKAAAEYVDVVTTATFGPMCSSGCYFNVGQPLPRIKLGGGKAALNNVPCYPGFAAADLMIGANALPEDDPRNKIYPGEFSYGGGHVIQDLVSGKDLVLEAQAYGTDCYPRKQLKTYINIKDLNEAVLFNMRNCYQNYNVAVNASNKPVYTYMGLLKAGLGNAVYSSAGALSPLLNDPLYKTIGIGTRIFLAGAEGYVAWWGTQHNPSVERDSRKIPKYPAGTLALIGDLKQMNPEWLKGTSMFGYGTTLSVGVGIPIPVLEEKIIESCAVKDQDIFAPVVDYSQNGTKKNPDVLGHVSYAELKSGRISLQGREIPCGTLSSLKKARDIAAHLKTWIEEKKFFLTEAVAALPGPASGYKLHPMKERKVKDA